MTTINEIFTTYGPEYIRRFGDHMPRGHLKVINVCARQSLVFLAG